MAHFDYEVACPTGDLSTSIDDYVLGAIDLSLRINSSKGKFDRKIFEEYGYWPKNYKMACLLIYFLRSRRISYSMKIIQHYVEKRYSHDDGTATRVVSECRIVYDDPDGTIYSEFVLAT